MSPHVLPPVAEHAFAIPQCTRFQSARKPLSDFCALPRTLHAMIWRVTFARKMLQSSTSFKARSRPSAISASPPPGNGVCQGTFVFHGDADHEGQGTCRQPHQGGASQLVGKVHGMWPPAECCNDAVVHLPATLTRVPLRHSSVWEKTGSATSTTTTSASTLATIPSAVCILESSFTRTTELLSLERHARVSLLWLTCATRCGQT